MLLRFKLSNLLHIDILKNCKKLTTQYLNTYFCDQNLSKNQVYKLVIWNFLFSELPKLLKNKRNTVLVA